MFLLTAFITSLNNKSPKVQTPSLLLFQQETKQTDNRLPISQTLSQTFSQTLSYQQLNQRANKIAHYLMLKNLGKGSRVGLCLERSIDMVASLFGILKAGATYVPLDPHHPRERLAYIIQDAQIDGLITTTNVAVSLEVTSPLTTTLYLDQDIYRIEQQSSENPTVPTCSADIAYILYTSGSTGKPKGVPIRHCSLSNFLASMAEAPGMKKQDTLLAVTTLGFDIAALEIFLPLVVGAQLVLTSLEVATDGEQLAAQLTAHNITVMQATPATWRLLLDAGWAGSPALKILCGGEALDLNLADQLVARSKEVWNLYGPTETTIWSGALRIDANILLGTMIPIGRPIANTQFYVLDRQQRQVPVGVAGELYVGGLGLSSGYWNRDDLTAEKFVEVEGLGCADLAQASSAHILFYKTGDRVRYRENGTLDYLGRLDNQVKLRGFRIELGEIESCLAQHPQVEQVVVEVATGENPQLVAYLTLIEESDKGEGNKKRDIRE